MGCKHVTATSTVQVHSDRRLVRTGGVKHKFGISQVYKETWITRVIIYGPDLVRTVHIRTSPLPKHWEMFSVRNFVAKGAVCIRTIPTRSWPCIYICRPSNIGGQKINNHFTRPLKYIGRFTYKWPSY